MQRITTRFALRPLVRALSSTALSGTLLMSLTPVTAVQAQMLYGATGGEGATGYTAGAPRGGNGGDAGQPGQPGEQADPGSFYPPAAGGAAGSAASPDGGEGGESRWWDSDMETDGAGGGGGGYSHVVDGDIATPMQGGHGGAGGDGGPFYGAHGGGGAGGDGVRNQAANPDVLVTADVTGGDGGGRSSAASIGSYLTGGGGGGGAGFVMVNEGQLTIAGARVAGGRGGGGEDVYAFDTGGGGGAGIVMSAGGRLDQSGEVLGAAGGAEAAGGAGVVMGGRGNVDNRGRIVGGGGGAYASGGAGLELRAGGAVSNTGEIAGGRGGEGTAGGSNRPAGGTGSGGAAGYMPHTGSAGTGGAGIRGADVQIVNSGTIAGGQHRCSGCSGLADAITFTGGTNRLELRAGAVIEGNVDASAGSGDVFVLGGASGASLDASRIVASGSAGAYAEFIGFEHFEKAGTGTWTLTGATDALTAWVILEGALAVSSDEALGEASQPLTIDGGALRNTAAFTTARDIRLGDAGGTLQTDADLTVSGTVTASGTGAGGLAKTGTATLRLNGAPLVIPALGVDAGTVDVATGLRTDNARIDADGSDATGTPMVRVGEHGEWTSAMLAVGDGARGDLVVDDGGRVDADVFVMANDAAGIGAVRISGTDSTLTAAGVASIGHYGNGTVVIEDRGRLEAGVVLIGAGHRHATGAVTVAGEGSVLETTQDGSSPGWSLGVGFYGNGTLTLTDGGQAVAAGAVHVATEEDAVGAINFGAASGDDAEAAGTLDAASVHFGAGAGSLVFNHTGNPDGSDLVFAASLVDEGAVLHENGRTVFTGDSSAFSGTTAVSGGTLLVDGTLGDAAGAVDVDTGGALGGRGAIGGAVSVAEGTLIGVQGQTLAMSSLRLGAGATVDVALGAPADTALFDVGGDLTLDGTLNVTDAGGFGAGVYRIFDYEGELTDEGIEIGSAPVALSRLSVQTAAAGQVNLVSVTAGPLSFWDGGDPALHENGVVDGGAGAWRTDGENWTQADGAINGPYQPNPTFAVFQGTGGEVTVDAAAGDVGVTGMQFAVDGYRVQGDAVELAGEDGETVIRVGDGTTAGADMQARIASELTGASRLIKRDLGTLTLAGANTYSGGTRVAQGTLRAARTGALGGGPVEVEDQASLSFEDGVSAEALSIANRAGGELAFLGTASAGDATIVNDGGLVFRDVSSMAEADITNTGGIDVRGAATADNAGIVNEGSIRFRDMASAGDASIATTGGALAFHDDASAGSSTLRVRDGTIDFHGRADAGMAHLTAESDGFIRFAGDATAGQAVAVTEAGSAVDIVGLDAAGIAIGSLSGGGEVLLGEKTLTLGGLGRDDTISGVIQGDAGSALVKAGTGTLTLTADNTYTGVTRIEAGTLAVGDGGATGAVRGDIEIAAASRLVFDRDGQLTHEGVLSGAGDVQVTGPGVVALTGESAGFAGTTEVGPGSTLVVGTATGGALGGSARVREDATLRVDGRFAGPVSVSDGALVVAGHLAGPATLQGGTLQVDGELTGDVTARAGGRVSGAGGTIGGAADVTGGGVLAGTQGTRLRIDGDLRMDGSSVVDVALGAPSTDGLFDVGGDLTLDGTLNVTDAGGFGMGVYRIFDYEGELTDGGIDIGTAPTPLSRLSVQTAATGQVNLVSGAQGALSFWDGGDPARHDNGVIDGGAGTWRTDGENWTQADGAINGPYRPNPTFAVFQGAAGEVTVDAAAGDIGVTGMQFAADGYRVQGDAIALAADDGETVIRVGDGTAAGAGMQTRIASSLTGASRLVKRDLGTLTLEGANAYTGGTRVEAGVLSVSADASLGEASGGLELDGGTLRGTGDWTLARAVTLGDNGGTVQADAMLTVAGAIDGDGALAKTGGGTLALAGANAYTGGTTVSQGALAVRAGGTLGTGDVVVEGGELRFMADASAGDLAIANTGGHVAFHDASAGQARIDNQGGINFYGTASAGTARIVNRGSRGLSFNDASSAGSATLVAQDTAPIGFYGTSTADQATLIAHGRARIDFRESSSAGAADIELDAGTRLRFFGASTADAATVVNRAAGVVDVSSLTTDGIAIGSLSGEGEVLLGEKTLTLGGLDRDDTISGVVQGDAGSALVKAGTGTLTLTADNAYTGATRVEAGTLAVGVGGATGSIPGDIEIAQAGRLVLDRDGRLAHGGVLSGAGDVEVNGPGVVTLTGESAGFAGTTEVGSGSTLIVGTLAGGALGGSARVQEDATLQVDGRFAGPVSASDGALVVNGRLAGPASLQGGTLRVDGELTGDVEARAGGTVSGTGAVGGVADLRGGGVLAGAQGTRLRVDGNVLMDDTSVMNVALGAPSTDGLFDVGGDLALDGTLNVADAGGFGRGVYRLFDYEGALTDNGLAVGETPVGVPAANLAVQTAAPGAVNLVWASSDGGGQAALGFWDGGDAALHGNGRVDGGSGAWRADGGNWTGADGAVNGPYRPNPTFAIFQGRGGEVTVDASAGAIGATGMQFAADGYRLRGDAIALAGEAGETVIRVGDGTAAGAGLTAVIASGLTGASRLIKRDHGTLVLEGDNTYTGGTRIESGTLAIGDGGASGSIAGDASIASAGRLVFERGGQLTHGGVLSGTGRVDVAGPGTVTFTGESAAFAGTTTVGPRSTLVVGTPTGGALGGSARVQKDAALRVDGRFAGPVSVHGGTLRVDGRLAGDATVRAGGTVSGTGTVGGSADLTDGGVLAGTQGMRLRIDGDVMMDDTSVVDVALGAPSTDGLFDVGGNLVLDGTLNVADAGGFDTGVYRLFDYAGGLTNDGLAVGEVPVGVSAVDLMVQTSVVGAVNLVRSDGSAGDRPRFWDGGDAGLHNNGRVDGGAGAWRAGGSNWTGADGRVNGAYQPNPNFAVFQGAGSEVTVDTSRGAIGVTGLQFATDGYRLQGDAVTLQGADGATPIRVGDGTTAGAGMSATIASELTGASRLVKRDQGTLVLAGYNTYTGGTRVEAGVLSAGSDANLGDAAGGLDFAGGTLRTTAAFATARPVTLSAGGGTLQTQEALTLTGRLAGNGTLNKTGAGALTLTGDSAGFAGRTRVAAGTLVVGRAGDAAVLGGTLDVLAGARLAGSGTVGSTRVAGTVAPGNSLGTLTVAGDYVQQAGSTYEAEIEPGGASDRIAVTGTATIEGGTVSAVKAPGSYRPGTRYTLLSAEGGVAGTYDALTQNAPLVDLALAYDPGHVYLDVVRNAVSFCEVAASGNQCATGRAAQSTGPGHAVHDAIAGLPDADSVQAGLDALSGEVHASLRTGLIEDGRFVRQAAGERLRAALGGTGAYGMPTLAYRAGEAPVAVAPDHGGPVFWGQGLGAWGKTEGNGNAATLDRSTEGLLVGGDAQLGDWRVGALAGYSRSRSKVRERDASASVDSYHLGLYGGTQWGRLALRSGVAYTWHEVETARSVALPGLAESLKGEYRGGTVQAFGELGYAIELGEHSRLEPFANLAHVRLHTRGYAESGGDAALRGERDTNGVTFTTFGLRASHALATPDMDVQLQGALGWRHAFGDTTPSAIQAFSAGDAFAVAGAPIARNSAVIEAGLAVRLAPNATLGLSYTGQLASGARDHGVKASFSMRF